MRKYFYKTNSSYLSTYTGHSIIIFCETESGILSDLLLGEHGEASGKSAKYYIIHVYNKM